MKIKPLNIVFESLDEFATRTKAQLKKAVLSGKAQLSPRNTICFASVAAYQQVMSDQKYAILATIYKHDPQSIYQLAKLLARPSQNVIRDCNALKGYGFITYEETGDGRKTKAPRLAFDYNAIVVCIPNEIGRASCRERV